MKTQFKTLIHKSPETVTELLVICEIWNLLQNFIIIITSGEGQNLHLARPMHTIKASNSL